MPTCSMPTPPADTARWVVSEILGHGRVRRPILGLSVSLSPLPRELARRLDLLLDAAVEIVAIEPGGAAARGGLRPGDLVVAIDGRLVTGVDDMHRLLSRAGGGAVALSIVRGVRRLEIDVEPRFAE